MQTEDEEIWDLIPNTKWPGQWITPQPDIPINYEDLHLHHILQSAKQIFNADINDEEFLETVTPRSHLKVSHNKSNKKVSKVKLFCIIHGR